MSVAMTGSSTSNLKWYHLDVHENLYKKLLPQQVTISTLLNSSSQKVNKWKSNDGSKQKEIINAIASFVALDLQPFSVVESPAFHRALEKAEPHYTMPSRKHLSTKLIPARHSEIFSDIVRLMQLVPQLCATLDIWTNRQIHSYIGMRGHFIVDFKLKSIMLACNRFQGSHTGEEILLHFKRIESDFEINGKVDNIVTDNGSNMLKAFRLLSLEIEDDMVMRLMTISLKQWMLMVNYRLNQAQSNQNTILVFPILFNWLLKMEWHMQTR